MPRSTWKGRWNRVQKWKETGSFVSKDTLSRAMAAAKRPGEVLIQSQGAKKPTTSHSSVEGITFGVVDGSLPPGSQSQVLFLPIKAVSDIVAVNPRAKDLVTGDRELESEVDLGVPVIPTVPKISRAQQLASNIETQCNYILASQLKKDEPLRKLGVGLVGAPNSVCGFGWKEFNVDPDKDSTISIASGVKSAPPDIPDGRFDGSESGCPCGQGDPQVLTQQDMEYQIFQFEKDVVLPPSAHVEVGSFVDVTSHDVLSKFTPLVVGDTVNPKGITNIPVVSPKFKSPDRVVDNKSFEERRTLGLVKTLLDNRRESEQRRLDSRMESLLDARLLKQQELYAKQFDRFKSEQVSSQTKLQRSLDLLVSRHVPSAAQGVPDKVAMPPPPNPPPKVSPVLQVPTIAIPNPFAGDDLRYIARDKVVDWNMDQGSNSKGSVAGDDFIEPKSVKLNEEQVTKFNEWVDVVYDTVKGLPRVVQSEDDQSSIWPEFKGLSSRSTLPLHNQVIEILQKSWKDPKLVKPLDSQAFALFKINEEHHDLYTQPRIPDRYVALSVKGPTADKVMSSKFPKLLTKNFSSTVASSAAADFAASSLALKMANYQALSTGSCQTLLKEALDNVVDESVREPLVKLAQGLAFMQATGFYQADLASKSQVRANSMARAAWLEETEFSKPMKANLLAMPVEIGQKSVGDDKVKCLMFGSKLEASAKEVAEAIKV
jgi:hypothetical protein